MRLGEYFDQILYSNCIFKVVSLYRTIIVFETELELGRVNYVIVIPIACK